ncbi:hypothetical protein BE04_30945 [Sorangium cellulosum]|uniref:Protein kinase domain-containing protein n=2 Tax=Sorangium cellulosum TaxID=56 RepID=A0A150PMW4_SORCE|nr:protein kinase [Sorangium cellulosum]AGP37543.1 hypothetical protein SCE1572_25445 [Sorangium cellulosum So0157-2]KYF57035.1 hypothetical protein BE04_30945 [Sorangium cellulosum]
MKLADLGLATCLSRQQQPAGPPRLIEGSLPYMAPEQTGRMSRAIDGRADLYALGVTFYEMLTGRLPFEARDPSEWVLCHVARAPPPAVACVRVDLYTTLDRTELAARSASITCGASASTGRRTRRRRRCSASTSAWGGSSGAAPSRRSSTCPR